MSEAELTELEAALAKMTPGPWETIGTSVTDWVYENKTCSMEFIPNRWSDKQTDDARGIVALRNAAPALLAAAREAVRLSEEVHECTTCGMACRQCLCIEKQLASARNQALEDAAKLCEEADRQDEIDNGVAATGAAFGLATTIRALKGAKP